MHLIFYCQKVQDKIGAVSFLNPPFLQEDPEDLQGIIIKIYISVRVILTVIHDLECLGLLHLVNTDPPCCKIYIYRHKSKELTGS